MKRFKEKINNATLRLYVQVKSASSRTLDKLREKDGAWTDEGLIIVIGVVIAALVLTFLVRLFTDKIFPASEDKIDSFFNMAP